MRTTPWLAAVLSSTALVACGGGGDKADAPPSIDSPVVPDGPPGPPDADPNAPDAVPGAFACNGQPNPTTAPASIDVGGTTVELSASGTPPVANTTVDLFLAGGTTPLATTTSNATGVFTFTGLTTGGTAVDGYLRGTFPGNRKTVYVFPPQPLHESQDNVLVASASDAVILVLNAAFLEPDQADASGAVGVLVTDCLGNPLAGATVSANPAGTQVLYRDASGNPSPTATSTGPDGIGIIANVPPGMNVTVDAQYQGYNMREHTIFVKSINGDTDKALSTTIVIP